MSWNIGIMCVKAKETMIDDIIPDIFYKTKDISFEEATSCMMCCSLAIAHTNSWFIILDNQARFITKQDFALTLSANFPVKTFYISEELIYRNYINKNLTEEYHGIYQGFNYLHKNKLGKINSYGETLSWQIFNNEIYENSSMSILDNFYSLKFIKFDLK